MAPCILQLLQGLGSLGGGSQRLQQFVEPVNVRLHRVQLGFQRSFVQYWSQVLSEKRGPCRLVSTKGSSKLATLHPREQLFRAVADADGQKASDALDCWSIPNRRTQQLADLPCQIRAQPHLQSVYTVACLCLERLHVLA